MPENKAYNKEPGRSFTLTISQKMAIKSDGNPERLPLRRITSEGDVGSILFLNWP